MIKYQIITSTGLDVREKNSAEAMLDIRDYSKRHHPWLYLDGQPTNPDTLTEEQLQSAQMVVLTHTILGG
jgi:hypothetical protein